MSTTQHTPEHVLSTVCGHFNVETGRTRNMQRPNAKDHADGVARASKVAQALLVELCDMNYCEVARWMGRTESTVRSSHKKVNRDVKTDFMLARDIGRIVRAL